MNFIGLLDSAEAATAAAKSGGGAYSWIIMIAYVAIFGVGIYFLMIRPQKKQQAKMKTLLSSMEVGDSVLTTAGFYGVVIGIEDDTIIVEFGNNKNCRIPMQKSAVVEIEKPEDKSSEQIEGDKK